jgi:hypothetical protein
VPPRGSPQRSELLATLAEVFPETAADLEARLAEAAPWLVDVATVDEAERLKAFVEATSPARLTVVLAVGPRPPARTAALLVLEQRLADRRARAASEAAEASQRRQAEARERAKALAAERTSSGPLDAIVTPRPRRTLPAAAPPPPPPPETEAAGHARWFVVAAVVAVAGGLLALSRCAGDDPPATAQEAR